MLEDLGEKLQESLDELNRWEKIAIGIFLFSLIIRVAYHQHGLWIDEGRGLDIARDMVTEGKFKSGKEARPFYYFLLMVFLVFSGFSTFAGKFLIILMGASTVLLTFFIGKEIYNEKIGIFASVLLALHPLHWFLSTRVLSDVAVTFMVALTSYLFIRAMERKEEVTLYLSAVSLGLATLTKESGIITILPMAVYLLVKRRQNLGDLLQKKYLISLLLVTIIVGSWFTVTYFSWGEGYFLDFALGILTERGEAESTTRQVHPGLLYYTKQLPGILRWPLLVVFVLGIFSLILAKFKNSLYVLFWFLSFLAVASLLYVKVPRYLLPLLPSVCLIGGFGMDKVRRDFGEKEKRILGVIAVGLVVVSFLQFRAGHQLIVSKSQGWARIGDAGRWLRAHTTKEDEIVASSVGQIRWFSNRKCHGVGAFSPKEDFEGFIQNNTEIKYLELDTWEIRMREEKNRWVYSYLPKHNETFKPVKAFQSNGRTVIVIYEINR